MDPTPYVQAISAVAAFGSALIAWWAKHHAQKGAEYGRSIEDAVNHRHPDHNGTVPPRLFDIALENRATLGELKLWKDSYGADGDGQGLLDTGDKVRRFVESNDRAHDELREGVREIKEKLNEQAHPADS